MKVLVTGSNSMLAQDLIPVLKERNDVAAFSREDLDITGRGNVYEAIKTLPLIWSLTARPIQMLTRQRKKEKRHS